MLTQVPKCLIQLARDQLRQCLKSSYNIHELVVCADEAVIKVSLDKRKSAGRWVIVIDYSL